MRLPLIPPSELTQAQKPLYADMKKGIGSNFNAFLTVAPEGTAQAGALMGPWNPWLHEPRIGGAIWELTKAMTMEATLPDPVRQTAILVTGAHFNAAYEIYAHVAVAEKDAMSNEQLATLVSGSRPSNLSKEEGIGYDVAYALVNGGVLPEPVYRLAVDTFGQHGANELIHLVGLYCLVSMTLNGFNVPVPERE
jgi:4-carboxymuconolactone decarboxylase